MSKKRPADPYAAREAQKYDNPIPSREYILEQLEQAGVKHVYYESPGTGHEFLTWRRSLNRFAQLIFQD